MAFVLFVVASLAISFVPRPPQKAMSEPRTWSTLLAGFRFVWREKVVLGAISLDLFAVLLGGATALLPAYVRDILAVGPWGLGILRSAMGIGAIVMAGYLTFRPIRDRAGVLMFLAVALFGAFIVVFGLSRAVWLSALALALAGAADMVSVYIRETLIQLWTPDAVRGRVNAVNNVFIGASNELGEFRAGSMAALIGVVPAVVVGGIGTLIIAGLWAYWFPDISPRPPSARRGLIRQGGATTAPAAPRRQNPTQIRRPGLHPLNLIHVGKQAVSDTGRECRTHGSDPPPSRRAARDRAIRRRRNRHGARGSRPRQEL